MYIVGIKSQGGLNKPLEALQIISLAAAEALIVETTFLKQLISHSEPLLAIRKRVFLATVPSANTIFLGHHGNGVDDDVYDICTKIVLLKNLEIHLVMSFFLSLFEKKYKLSVLEMEKKQNKR